MILGNLILAAVLVILVATLAYGITVGARDYMRYRGKRLVTCPETHQAAAVHVDAGKAATTALIGKHEVRLDQCSRWPERRNCGQDCLSQVNADPAHCLVWNIVAEWYKGKSCAYCQKPFTEMHWHDRHPALLSPERVASSGTTFHRNNYRRFSRRTCRSAGIVTSRKRSASKTRSA